MRLGDPIIIPIGDRAGEMGVIIEIRRTKRARKIAVLLDDGSIAQWRE